MVSLDRSQVPLAEYKTPGGACFQETEWYFEKAKPTKQEREVIDFVNAVREEDIPICESVQRGLHSQGYKQGKFIVDPERSYISEHAVHDFQSKVLNALT